MKVAILFLGTIFFVKPVAVAQKTQPVKTMEAYGVVDTADLKLTSCDFEKDANAMVLFDKATVTYENYTLVMKRHKRIKIFNDNGRDQADVRIEFYGVDRTEEITSVEAETINLNDKAIEYTSVDKKLIFTHAINKSQKAIVFTFPNVKAGSVIEFKYTWSTDYQTNYPEWSFQSRIPERYSEFDAGFDHQFLFQYDCRVYQPLFKDTIIKLNDNRDNKHVWALSNIKAYKSEPYMDYPANYLQCVLVRRYFARLWPDVGVSMLDNQYFGTELKTRVKNDDEIIEKAKKLKTREQKIAYLFNTVKNTVKWNKGDYWFTVDGVKKAWEKKVGNSTEINIILYNFLRLANVKAILMAVCTRSNGKVDTIYPSTSYFNRTVVYCPVDSDRYYVLDASNPYNSYRDTPLELMGLQALFIDPENKKFGLYPITYMPVHETTLINGTIASDGKLEGDFQVSGTAYSREKYLKLFDEVGEKKYLDQLQNKDNNLKITTLKMENADNDTLPLIQTFQFKYNLTEPDGAYIYFNPNVLTGFERNPFLSETRVSNINFGGLYSYSINGRYKIPAGYKIDVSPKLVNMAMPDKSIQFKRLIGEQNGEIEVHYTVDYKRALFLQDEYKSVRDFYKKMYEMLNEQIVLKKQ
jgi:Domain of Unknown Function with PDB structure (DUF3857)